RPTQPLIPPYLIQQNNYLQPLIPLPPNIFYPTTIPTSILVFKKSPQQDHNLLFIHPSNHFQKPKNQNHLTHPQLHPIIPTYNPKQTIHKYTYTPTLQHIPHNHYNLNIPPYLHTFQQQPPIHLHQLQQHFKNIHKQIPQIQQQINPYLKQLALFKHH
uniref:N-6 DNA methylase n=1 Tax=Staphylococcus aureus TaxID=1280 RepID=UPI0011A32C9D